MFVWFTAPPARPNTKDHMCMIYQRMEPSALVQPKSIYSLYEYFDTLTIR